MITYLPLLIVSLPILKLNVEICQSHSFFSSIFLIVSTGLCFFLPICCIKKVGVYEMKLWEAENQQKGFEQPLKMFFLLQSSQQNIFDAAEVASQNISQ